MRYQPTYEELKRAPSYAEYPSTHCYQPTYEELKLAMLVEVQTLRTGYQPTYEELKQLIQRLKDLGADKLPAYL